MYWCLTFKLHYSNFSPIPAFWFLHFEPTQNCTSERGKTKSVGKIIQFFDDFSRAWSVLKITEDLCSTERGDSFSLGALQIFRSCPSYSLHPLASLLCKNIEKPAQLDGHLVLHPGSGSAHVSKVAQTSKVLFQILQTEAENMIQWFQHLKPSRFQPWDKPGFTKALLQILTNTP